MRAHRRRRNHRASSTSGRTSTVPIVTRPALARRATALGAAGLVAAGALIAAGGPASAASSVKAKYQVSRSTFLAGPHGTVELRPGVLGVKVTRPVESPATLSRLP